MNPRSKPLKRIGVVANTDKPAAVSVARSAVESLAGRADVGIQQSAANIIGYPHLGVDDDDLRSRDAVFVFGGDGTILRTSRLVGDSGTPMLGINLGRFGFLNEVAPEMFIEAMDLFLTGNYEIEERFMLEAFVMRGAEIIGRDFALNEFVLGYDTLARILYLAMSINGRYVTTYAADGIILATPTGSTAYSLSAGGPLVHPNLNVILLTPVCPHTLTTRALVIPDNHEIQVAVERGEGQHLRATADGQRVMPMLTNDILHVRKAPFRARLITHVGGATFYEKLQTKLRWGERFADSPE